MRAGLYMLALLFLLPATPALGAATVELELLTEPDFPALEQQEWVRAMSALDVGNVRIRQGQPGEKAEVTTRGVKPNLTYVVVGILRKNGELLVPGGRFKKNDRGAMTTWLNELKTYGPQGSPEGKPLYGLSAAQFGDVKLDLSTKAPATKGLSRAEALRKIGESLKMPIFVDASAGKILAGEKVDFDTQGLSAGTAIAYVLRPAGMAMKPERLPSGEIRYVVAQGAAVAEPWPVGWPLVRRRQEVLPQLFEMIDVEIEQVPLRKALDVIAERAQLPVLLDQNSLVKHEVDIDQAMVEFPAKRSTYSLVLTRLLGQARLMYEVRQDEAGKPFMWVTTIKQK